MRTFLVFVLPICSPYNSLRKLKLYNLGSEVDISFVLFNTKTKKIDQDTDKYYFVLFNTKTKKIDQDTDKYYATKKRSRIGI